MNFPDREHRVEQYRTTGLMIADVAKDIGLPISDKISDQWAETMARLATADDISETDPHNLTPETLLEYLNLPDNYMLLVSCARLLAANIASHKATTIKEHFASRSAEASESLNLLKYQCAYNLSFNIDTWNQLDQLSRLAIHADSLVDAREDAKRLPQFTARQLSINALVNIINCAHKIRPQTWMAIQRSAKKTGFDKHMIGSIRKNVLMM
ncbi:MAG: hypothetical protein ACM3KH_00215 [Thiobacillus sp.]